MITPKVAGLMDKLGVAVEVTKSGSEKDIAPPFRASTPEEMKILQDLIDRLGRRFLDLVALERKVDGQTISEISAARIYPAEEALRLKLVDGVGYLDDAINEARALASLPEGSRIVVYRRAKQGNDTLCNTSASRDCGSATTVFNSPFPGSFGLGIRLAPGPYYLWLPGILAE
jgi:protease-4